MPTYVYACDECGVQFEEFQSFNSKPLETCPQGHEGTVRRVFQPVGIVFKGSGWYITDSRKSESAGVGLSDTSSKNEASTKQNNADSSSDKASEKPVEKSSEKSSTSETTSSKSKSSASTSTNSPAPTTP